MKLTRHGFTLVEVLIVVVIMAILAAVVIPQYLNTTGDAKASTNKINLRMLRGQIALYRAQHNGVLPSVSWAELTKNTDFSGTIGTGPTYSYGPYLREIPMNTITNARTVKAITQDPATAGDVTGSGGWLYNTTTGGIWIDDPTQYVE